MSRPTSDCPPQLGLDLDLTRDGNAPAPDAPRRPELTPQDRLDHLAREFPWLVRDAQAPPSPSTAGAVSRAVAADYVPAVPPTTRS